MVVLVILLLWSGLFFVHKHTWLFLFLQLLHVRINTLESLALTLVLCKRIRRVVNGEVLLIVCILCKDYGVLSSITVRQL